MTCFDLIGATGSEWDLVGTVVIGLATGACLLDCASVGVIGSTPAILEIEVVGFGAIAFGASGLVGVVPLGVIAVVGVVPFGVIANV